MLLLQGFVSCNRRLKIVHFRRNKSDPDRRFNFDPLPRDEEFQIVGADQSTSNKNSLLDI